MERDENDEARAPPDFSMQCDRVAVVGGRSGRPPRHSWIGVSPTAGADVATIVAGSDPSFYLCGATLRGRGADAAGIDRGGKREACLHRRRAADAELLGRAVVDIAFVDNIVVNRAGPDLIVFESYRSVEGRLRKTPYLPGKRDGGQLNPFRYREPERHTRPPPWVRSPGRGTGAGLRHRVTEVLRRSGENCERLNKRVGA